MTRLTLTPSQRDALHELCLRPDARATVDRGVVVVITSYSTRRFRRSTFGALARAGLVRRTYAPSGYTLTQAGFELGRKELTDA